MFEGAPPMEMWHCFCLFAIEFACISEMLAACEKLVVDAFRLRESRSKGGGFFAVCFG